ncbi:vignain-like [Benincasa hispida]|uniref:vignain-like n=1 Tax=Benincasa hispida TaxID=102211 RepID=UPI0018FFAE6C|nr:vignain-like [Benincasa hispida]
MSDDEFINTHVNSNIKYYENLHDKKTEAASSGRVGGFMYEHIKDLPSSIEWRKKGAVNDIKNLGSCGNKRMKIDGYENVPPNNENALKKVVAHRSVSIAASGRRFRYYLKASSFD